MTTELSTENVTANTDQHDTALPTDAEIIPAHIPTTEPIQVEPLEIQVPPVVITEKTSLEPAIKTSAIESPKMQTANVEKKSENGKRLSITVNFPGEEAKYIQEIIDARIQSGLSSDKGNFIRQSVDFAIHMERLYGRHQKGFSFATPDIPVLRLKDGFPFTKK